MPIHPDDEYIAEAEYDEFRATRLLLAPEYRDLPTEDIGSLLRSTLPEMAPEDAEDFFRDAARAFRAAGREIGRRGPDILAGAGAGLAAGSALGIPGAIAGAVGGAVVGGVTSRAGRPAAAAPPPVPSPEPAPGPPPSGSGRDLTAMLAQPQTGLAVLTSLLGPSGRRTLPVGGQQIPVSSILAALGTLATRAAEDLADEDTDESEAVPAHLLTAEQGFAVDPADPDARAGHVLRLLSEATAVSLESEEDPEYDEDLGYDEDDEADYDEADDEAFGALVRS
jgi:hypothetical protein